MTTTTQPHTSTNGHSQPGGPSEWALAPYAAPAAPQAPELAFNERQITLIRTQIAPGCSEDELALFLEVCRSTGLNPLMRQIYAIKRKVGEERRMTIQTGIDGYRLLAARTGLLAGIDDPVYDTEAGNHPERASVTVYRLVAGQRMPFTATSRWREYAALGRDGAPVAMWAKMPWLMLGKTAEALALRRAFPAELSGVYTGEEMAQADNPPPLPYVEAEPQQTAEPQARQATRTQAAHAAPWKAMSDPDVLAALNHLQVRGRAAVQAYLSNVKAEMEAAGLAWTRDQVLAELALHSGAVDADAAADEHDLAGLDTGAPGN